MATLDVPPSKPPPPPPPKRLSRPKITIQIPDSATPTTPKVQTARTPRPHTGPVYWAPPRYHGKVPGSPGSHISDPQMNPFVYMYHNKASDFMFKQFEGFKDFTMNTAKSGLSAGEKTAFWFYNKLRTLSKKWFTHLFLSLCLALYSVMGAAIFMALEGPNEDKYDKNLTDVRKDFAIKMELVWKNSTLVKNDDFNFFELVEKDFQEYENSFTAFMKHINSNDTHKKTWGFWNAMFYAGTIYTTIGSELNHIQRSW